MLDDGEQALGGPFGHVLRRDHPQRRELVLDRDAREVASERVEHQVVDRVVVERDDGLDVAGLQVLEGLRVRALADDLDLLGEPGRPQRRGQPRAERVAHGEHHVVDLRMAAQVGDDPVRRVPAEGGHRDVDRAVLAAGAVFLVRALELVSERLEDLEGGDVDVERVRVASAVGHDLRREALPDPAAVPRVRDVGQDPVAGLLHARGRHERHTVLLGLGELLGDHGARDRVEDHRVGALTEGGLERVLQLFGRAVGADGLGGPAEQRRALLDDVALDLAGLDAAADVHDLLAGRDLLADGLGELQARRPRARLLGELLRRRDVRVAARRGRVAVRVASASGRRKRGSDDEERGALVRAVPQAVDWHLLLLL